MAVTHAGITSDDFTEIVADWIATARHPRSSTLYRARLFADAGVAEFSARRGKNWQRKYFSDSLYRHAGVACSAATRSYEDRRRILLFENVSGCDCVLWLIQVVVVMI
jgi:hypothetical protein